MIFSVNTGVGQSKHYVLSGQQQRVTTYSYRHFSGLSGSFECIEAYGDSFHIPLTEVTLPFAYPVAVPLRLE